MTTKTPKIITIPYSIGDKVWCLTHFQYTREVECLKCNYTGKLTLANGDPVDCDNCRGTKVIFKSFPMMSRPELKTIEKWQVENDIVKFSCKEDRGFRGFCSHGPEDFFTSFLECRRAARAFNKKYKWPREKYERDDFDESRMYRGYRTSNSKAQLV